MLEGPGEMFGSVMARLCPSSTQPPATEGTQGPLVLFQSPTPASVCLCDKLLFHCRPAFGDMRMGSSSGHVDSLPWLLPNLFWEGRPVSLETLCRAQPPKDLLEGVL